MAVAYTRRVYIVLVQLLQCFTRIRGQIAHARANTMWTGKNEASEIKYVSFRLTTEEYTQIENRGCLSAATPFDCVSRTILNDPKMRLGLRILGQKYLRVAGSSTPISRLLIMKSELGSSKNRYSNGCRARQPSAIEAQVLNVCPKQPTQRMWRWE